MSRLAVIALLLVSSVHAEPPATHQVKLNGHTFTLPKGFTIELVAKSPLVDRPISASFDDRGRLYVTDSSGSNEKPTEQLKNPTHRIIRLEDTKGDGVFDKATVFADKMMFPEGILWHRGSVLCCAPPHIWKLTDTDDDGKADKREIWFDGKTVTGCANDLHGPYLGPDGWIYWTKGAFAEQTYTLPNGKPFKTRAAHIFRARPDGTGIEPVMTGGMDNPVGVAFLPNGERFFTTTFFQHPEAGKRDGIVHAIYGGIYGKDHDVIYDKDHKWTSPNLMPVMTHLGPAAPCGMICYHTASEHQSNLFVCQFNLRKVSRHVLKPVGATYQTEDHDFVVSDNQDFHPTDVVEDADGSLLIVDTGGWYKLCCPSSQLVKADVLGAIYRVRKEGTKKIEDPRGAKIDWDRQSRIDLIRLLADPRPVVQRRAIEAISKLKGFELHDTLSRAQRHPTAIVRKNTLLVLSRIPMPTDKDEAFGAYLLVESALADVDAQVRQTAFHLASLLRGNHKHSAVRSQFAINVADPKGNLIEARLSAEAGGRWCATESAGTIIALLGYIEDRSLEHAAIFALIESGEVETIRASVKSRDPRISAGCLVALDQLGEKLDSKLVLESINSPDAALSESALWIATRHPEWGAGLTEALAKVMESAATPETRAKSAGRLASLAKNENIQRLLSETIRTGTSKNGVAVAIQAMARTGLKAPPDTWYAALEQPLTADANPDVALGALATLRSLPAAKTPSESLRKKLRELWNLAKPPELAYAAMATYPGGMNEVNQAELEMLLAGISENLPPNLRGFAAEVLSKAKLQPAQLEALIAVLPRVGPLELDRVLGAFAQTKDDAIGMKLLAALSSAELRPSLRADGVKERIKHFGPGVQKEAEKLYVALNADYVQQRAKLEEMSKSMPAGDVRRGQAVFNNQKHSCIVCHTIGYVGGKIVPDLTRIGGIRNDRDLLESILFPSASFVRSYEPLTVVLKDGRQFNGVPKKDAPDELILILAADKEQRISRDEIDEVRPGKVSIMPAGLDKQLSTQELADLVAFLRNCK